MAYRQLMKGLIQKNVRRKKWLDPMQQNHPSISNLLLSI